MEAAPFAVFACYLNIRYGRSVSSLILGSIGGFLPAHAATVPIFQGRFIMDPENKTDKKGKIR